MVMSDMYELGFCFTITITCAHDILSLFNHAIATILSIYGHQTSLPIYKCTYHMDHQYNLQMYIMYRLTNRTHHIHIMIIIQMK